MKFNHLDGLHFLTNIDFLARKVDSISSEKHLTYVETSPEATQEVVPSIWLGNMSIEHLRKATCRTPAARLYEFHDMCLAAHGCLIDGSGRMYASHYLRQDCAQLRAGGVNPGMIDATSCERREIRINRKLNILEINEPCIPLAQPGEASYENWLIDILPRVGFAQELGIKAKYISTIHIPKYARKLLHMMGVDDHDIITYRPVVEAVLMKKCYFPGHLRQDSAFAKIASDAYERLSKYRSVSTGRKIYVSRGDCNSNKNKIINVPDLFKLFSKFGIEIIEPHKFSIEDQIKIFSESSTIIGEYSSSLYNTVFSHRGTNVLVLQSNKTSPFVQAGIGALLNQPTGFIFGEHSSEKSQKLGKFNVPLDLVQKALEQIIM